MTVQEPPDALGAQVPRAEALAVRRVDLGICVEGPHPLDVAHHLSTKKEDSMDGAGGE